MSGRSLPFGSRTTRASRHHGRAPHHRQHPNLVPIVLSRRPAGAGRPHPPRGASRLEHGSVEKTDAQHPFPRPDRNPQKRAPRPTSTPNSSTRGGNLDRPGRTERTAAGPPNHRHDAWYYPEHRQPPWMGRVRRNSGHATRHQGRSATDDDGLEPMEPPGNGRHGRPRDGKTDSPASQTPSGRPRPRSMAEAATAPPPGLGPPAGAGRPGATRAFRQPEGQARAPGAEQRAGSQTGAPQRRTPETDHRGRLPSRPGRRRTEPDPQTRPLRVAARDDGTITSPERSIRISRSSRPTRSLTSGALWARPSWGSPPTISPSSSSALVAWMSKSSPLPLTSWQGTVRAPWITLSRFAAVIRLFQPGALGDIFRCRRCFAHGRGLGPDR